MSFTVKMLTHSTLLRRFSTAVSALASVAVLDKALRSGADQTAVHEFLY